MQKYIDYIKSKTGNSSDYLFRNLKIKNVNVLLMFNEVLTSSSEVSDFIIRKLINLNKKELYDISNNLPSANIKKISLNDSITYLNNGFLILIIKNSIVAIEARTILERGITTIQSELSIVGSKDSFSENFNTNLGLIRRRIKSENLWWNELTLGKSTLTKVGILYMNNIVDQDLVNSIMAKLKKIDIDGRKEKIC